MKKKLLLMLATVALVLVITGCEKADVTSVLTVTDLSGKGEKIITFAIPADRDTEVVSGTNNGVEYHIYNNSTYFPKGYKAFCDFVMSKLPDKGYTYRVREDNASYVYIDLSYSFDSFDEYVEKTKALMGEDRWEKGKFTTPGFYVTKVEDPLSDRYGDLCVTLGESRYITSGCVWRLCELAICQEAVDAGVLTPYGDAFKNKDCKQMFIDYDPAEDTFQAFADVYYLARPGEVCNNVSSRTYTYLDHTYTEELGDDAALSFYVSEGDGYTVTDPAPYLPEGATEGSLYFDGTKLLVLTPKEGVEDDGVWSLDDYEQTGLFWGSKPAGPKTLSTPLMAPSSGFPVWAILLIAAGTVLIVVGFVWFIRVKRAAAYEDEEEDDDEDEDDE